MEEYSSDFLREAYKTGRVRDVREAFEEFPPENEWHQGDMNYFLHEDLTEYNIYSVGDIIFVKNFLYEDGTEGHNHLFVIIDQNNIIVPIENFCMLISSQLDKLKYKTNVLLNKNDTNGLNKDSLVKTDAIYIIKSDQILLKIGSIDKEKIEEYKKEFLTY